jgi:hypothetical protein
MWFIPKLPKSTEIRMAAKPIFKFDAKALLAKIDGGKTILEYGDKRVVFA